jgi:hypothetical protein
MAEAACVRENYIMQEYLRIEACVRARVVRVNAYRDVRGTLAAVNKLSEFISFCCWMRRLSANATSIWAGMLSLCSAV